MQKRSVHMKSRQKAVRAAARLRKVSRSSVIGVPTGLPGSGTMEPASATGAKGRILLPPDPQGSPERSTAVLSNSKRRLRNQGLMFSCLQACPRVHRIVQRLNADINGALRDPPESNSRRNWA